MNSREAQLTQNLLDKERGIGINASHPADDNQLAHGVASSHGSTAPFNGGSYGVDYVQNAGEGDQDAENEEDDAEYLGEMNDEDRDRVLQLLSTRVKRIIKYDAGTRTYEISDDDEKYLQEYKVDLKRFRQTCEQIENDRNLRPFDKRLPCHRKLLLKLLSLFVLLGYGYACMLLLQLALFNLILLGIMLIYFSKLGAKLEAFILQHEYKYQISPLKRFIEQENVNYYKKLNVEISSEDGKWIEVQLPDTEEGGESRVPGSLGQEPAFLAKLGTGQLTVSVVPEAQNEEEGDEYGRSHPGQSALHQFK